MLPLREPADFDTMHVVFMQGLFFGMQYFCLSTPEGIDWAWGATTLFMIRLGDVDVKPGRFDPCEFVRAELEYWIAEFPSDDHCDMKGVTENDVRDGDSSILSITKDQWDSDVAQQLANLARNREECRQCIVNKVIAARAMRDGYGST